MSALSCMDGAAPTEAISFACGGTRFTLARDAAGRWDHNRHGDKVLAKFGDGGGIRQIKTVEALCGLMSEGLIPPERAANTAQGCYALSAGRSCRTVLGLDKDIMFLALSAQSDGSDPQLGYFPSAEKYGYRVMTSKQHISEPVKKRHRDDGSGALAEAKWIRKAMLLCDEIEDRVSAGASTHRSVTTGKMLVARSAAKTWEAWREDTTLWSDYLKWALPDMSIWDKAVDCLSLVMGDTVHVFGEGALLSGVLNPDDIPSAPEHPATTLFSHLKGGHHPLSYWELVPRPHFDPTIRDPDVGKMVAAAAKIDAIKERLNGCRSETLVEYDFMDGFTNAAKDLWEERVPLGVFGYEAPVILWKAAFRGIADTSLAANSLNFGPSARNLGECLLESFNRKGHPAWSPIYGRLADLAADAFMSITRTWFSGTSEIGNMIHNDLRELFKAISNRRISA